MKAKKKTLLWEFRKDPSQEDSFLFGTMHVRHLEAKTHPEFVFEKIDSCDAFAAEFHLEHTSSFHLPDEHFKLPDGQTLADHLSPIQYDKLKRKLKKMADFDLDSFNDVQPVIITNFLMESLLRRDMPLALDEYLWEYAKEQGKTLLGIETMEEQLAVLKKIDLSFQLKALLEIGRNYKKFRRNVSRMAEIYREGDIQKLQKTSKKGMGKLRKILLYRRNEIMAGRISEMASNQTLFAAIGAGHLGGEKGVLRLLKLKGWKVSPVKHIL